MTEPWAGRDRWDWMGCAVCGFPLDRFDAMEDGQVVDVQWLHAARSSRPNDDHIAVPVPLDQLVPTNRCDFCDTDENVNWLIEALSFRVPGDSSMSHGGWAACDDCKALAARRRWTQLATRVKQIGDETHLAGIGAVPRSALVDLYERLDAHMIGVVSIEEWLQRSRSARRDDDPNT